MSTVVIDGETYHPRPGPKPGGDPEGKADDLQTLSDPDFRDILLYDFDIDDAEVKQNHFRKLVELLEFLDRRLHHYRKAKLPVPNWKISIDAFCTKTGSKAHNDKLSILRETAVEAKLIQIAGDRELTTAFTVDRRGFHGFKDTKSEGEEPTWRSVRVVLHHVGVIPPPVDPDPKPPARQHFKIRLLSRDINVQSLPFPFNFGPTLMNEKVVFEIVEDAPPFRSAKFKMEGTGPAVQGLDIGSTAELLPAAFTPFIAFSATNAATHIDLGDFEGPASFVAGGPEEATLKMDGNLFKLSLHTIPRRIAIKGVQEPALSTSLDVELIEQP